jgi:hypothetical protein
MGIPFSVYTQTSARFRALLTEGARGALRAGCGG